MAVINTTAPLPASVTGSDGSAPQKPISAAPVPAVTPGTGANASTSGVGGGTATPKPAAATPPVVSDNTDATDKPVVPPPATPGTGTGVKAASVSVPESVAPPKVVSTPPAVPAPAVTTSQASAGDKATASPTTAAPAPAPATPTTATSTSTAPSGTPTGVPTLDELAKTAQDWVNGNIDQATYQTQLNQAINSLALSNNAAMEVLKSQINSNPATQGQPAGMALVTLLAQQQGLSVDTVLGNLSATTQQTILQMQQYGFTQLTQIQQQKQAQTQQQITDAITAGDFNTAASLMSANINAANPGMNVKIDPNSLAARDPQTLANLNSQMALVTSLASTNPDAATTMLEAIMATPAGAALFPPGTSAATIINGIHTGSAATTLSNASAIQSEINNLATSSTSFSQAQSLYQTLQSTGLYDFGAQGKSMTLDQINAVVTANGGQPYSGTPGNIVDAAGNPLTQTDYQNLAMQSDYQGRVTKANMTPMQTFLQTVQQNFPQYFNTVEFPGAVNAIDAWAALVSTPGNYTIDPTTGAIVPNPGTTIAPWLNSATAYLFNTWPSAHFNAQGQVVDSKGNISTNPSDYYAGMEAIGSQGSDGSTINATSNAAQLDSGYAAYAKNAGASALDMRQWYFATAGGTTAVNTANIPSTYAPTSAQLKAINNTGNTLGAGGNVQTLTDVVVNGKTLTPTGFAPQSGAALNAINNLITNGSFTAQAAANAPTINAILTGLNNPSVNRFANDGSINDAAKTLGMNPNDPTLQAFTKANFSVGLNHASGSTPDGNAFMALLKMGQEGMTAQQAYSTMALYLGASYMATVYQKATGQPVPAAWLTNTYTATSDNSNADVVTGSQNGGAT